MGLLRRCLIEVRALNRDWDLVPDVRALPAVALASDPRQPAVPTRLLECASLPMLLPAKMQLFLAEFPYIPA